MLVCMHACIYGRDTRLSARLLYLCAWVSVHSYYLFIHAFIIVPSPPYNFWR